MMAEIKNFGPYRVARRSSGEPVHLNRSINEVVFLAFDTATKRLVELHLLGSRDTLDAVSKKSAFTLAQRFKQLEGGSFTRPLTVKETQGLVLYTSYLSDGEFITNYIRRRGPLSPTTVFAVVLQLLEDVLLLDSLRSEVPRMRLDQVIVTTFEDTFLQLRVYDYDLSSPEITGDSRNINQVCRLLFLMLTGDVYANEHPDRFPMLTSLPMGLRTMMRTSLLEPHTVSASLDRLRDHIREAFGTLSGGINIKSLRKQRVVIPSLQPRSELQDCLLENMQMHEILGNCFQPSPNESGCCHPFSLPCLDAKSQVSVTLQVLPPARIVHRAEYEAAPTQLMSTSKDAMPNLLKCMSLWERPEWIFLTEEKVSGFPLSRLLAERVFLNPFEVAVLLRQIIAGQLQAAEMGVQRLDLHPSNILLCVIKEGALVQRELDRLMEKRLDVWPNLQVKVRAHGTMRQFYEAPLVERVEAERSLSDQQHQSLMLIALAAYLLTGQRDHKNRTRFPEATPCQLADYMSKCLEKWAIPEQLPMAIDFVNQFESLISTTNPDLNLPTRLSAAKIALSEIESVGSVSDFDDEWESSCLTSLKKVLPVKEATTPANVLVLKSYRRMPWETWTAAALVIFALVGAWAVIEPSSPRRTLSVSEMAGEVSMFNKQDVLVSIVNHEARILIPGAQVFDKKEFSLSREDKLPVEKAYEEKSLKVVHKLPQELILDQLSVTPPKSQEEFPALPAELEQLTSVAEPEVIRKAILPSPEEVETFKQSLAR